MVLIIYSGIWKRYFTALGGVPIFILVNAIFMAERFVYISCDWWLTMWTSAANGQPQGDFNFHLRSAQTMEDQHYYMYGYLIWCILNCIATTARCVVWPLIGTQISHILPSIRYLYLNVVNMSGE
jgi:hypothetical protein